MHGYVCDIWIVLIRYVKHSAEKWCAVDAWSLSISTHLLQQALLEEWKYTQPVLQCLSSVQIYSSGISKWWQGTRTSMSSFSVFIPKVYRSKLSDHQRISFRIMRRPREKSRTLIKRPLFRAKRGKVSGFQTHLPIHSDILWSRGHGAHVCVT